jgi:hypothetical protein
LHEAGIPPIHTPISVLNKLSKEIKEKLFLVIKIIIINNKIFN